MLGRKMGLTINLHAEVKINGEWRHYTKLWIRQDYRLFYKLTGPDVTGDDHDGVEPIPGISQRGLPNDATFETQFEFDNENHVNNIVSSWINREEIAELMSWLEAEKDPGTGPFGGWQQWKFLYGASWDSAPGTKGIPSAVEDWRFVFWFI